MAFITIGNDEVYMKDTTKQSKQYIDSGWAMYATGDSLQFINLKSTVFGKATFGDGKKAKTNRIRDIGKNSETFIQNVLPIDNFGYNLLNFSQLCNRNLFVLFKKHELV